MYKNNIAQIIELLDMSIIPLWHCIGFTICQISHPPMQRWSYMEFSCFKTKVMASITFVCKHVLVCAQVKISSVHMQHCRPIELMKLSHDLQAHPYMFQKQYNIALWWFFFLWLGCPSKKQVEGRWPKCRPHGSISYIFTVEQFSRNYLSKNASLHTRHKHLHQAFPQNPILPQTVQMPFFIFPPTSRGIWREFYKLVTDKVLSSAISFQGVTNIEVYSTQRTRETIWNSWVAWFFKNSIQNIFCSMSAFLKSKSGREFKVINLVIIEYPK